MELTITPAEKGFCLNATSVLGKSRDELFEFFSDAFQLEAITPPWLHFHVVTPGPLRIEPGSLIDYKLRIHGIPMKWRSRISVWEPPYRFVDEQLIGPYRRWHHEHVFEESDQGTLVRDIVHYSVPGGRLVNRFFVEPDLRKIFGFRLKKLEEMFGSPGPSRAPRQQPSR